MAVPGVIASQLQLTAMTRGIYISQQIAREIGVRPGSEYPDLLFDERNSPTSSKSGELYELWALSIDVSDQCYATPVSNCIAHQMSASCQSTNAIWLG